MSASRTLRAERAVQNPPAREVTRLNLVYPAETRERLERLIVATRASTITETIADAIRFYEWFIKQKESGREILVRAPGEDPKIVEFIT